MNDEFAKRIPLITPEGAQFLKVLEEHPRAPRFTHPGVDRVTPEGLEKLRAFADLTQGESPRWSPGRAPDWVNGFVEHCFRAVPIYRRYGDVPRNFFDLPTTARADLGQEPWAFVPDDQPLNNLIVYNTSGTTGHPLDILTHADTLALYTPLLEVALAHYGVTLTRGAGQVAIALVCFQKQTYTYATVSAALHGAGFVKVNLHPNEWRDPADRAAFLDSCAPEIYTGDPLAFAELATLSLHTHPKALVSTAMHLLPGLRRQLAAHFACPVLDVYSLNEAGPVAVEKDGVYHLLQPRLFVEILAEDGAPCPPGERGEITLTGGFNPFLPLLRYRTGDYASLTYHGDQPVLIDLVGRAPVVFRGRQGQMINNIDVSLALRDLPLTQFTLHQANDGALTFNALHTPEEVFERAQAILRELFGADQPLRAQVVETLGDKVRQYAHEP